MSKKSLRGCGTIIIKDTKGPRKNRKNPKENIDEFTVEQIKDDIEKFKKVLDDHYLKLSGFNLNVKLPKNKRGFSRIPEYIKAGYETSEGYKKALKKQKNKSELYDVDVDKEIYYDDLPDEEKREIDLDRKIEEKKEKQRMRRMNNKILVNNEYINKYGAKLDELTDQVDKDRRKLIRKAMKEAEESTPLMQYFKQLDKKVKEKSKMPIGLKEKVIKIDNIPSNLLNKKDIETLKEYVNHPKIKNNKLYYVKDKRERLINKIKDYEDKNGKVDVKINEPEKENNEIKKMKKDYEKTNKDYKEVKKQIKKNDLKLNKRNKIQDFIDNERKKADIIKEDNKKINEFINNPVINKIFKKKEPTKEVKHPTKEEIEEEIKMNKLKNPTTEEIKIKKHPKKREIIDEVIENKHPKRRGRPKGSKNKPKKQITKKEGYDSEKGFGIKKDFNYYYNKLSK